MSASESSICAPRTRARAAKFAMDWFAKKLQEVDYKAEVQELSINSLVRENAAKQLPGAAQQLP